MIEYIVDLWPEDDRRGKRKFIRKITGYSRQQGASFPAATMEILVWMIWTGDDSVHNIVSQVRPTQKEVSRLRKELRKHIKDAFDSYKRALANIHMGKEFYASKDRAYRIAAEKAHYLSPLNRLATQVDRLRRKSGEAWGEEAERCNSEASLNRVVAGMGHYADLRMLDTAAIVVINISQDPGAFSVGHEVGSIEIRFNGIGAVRSYRDLAAEWATFPLVQEQVANQIKKGKAHGLTWGEIAASLHGINPGPASMHDRGEFMSPLQRKQNEEWARTVRITHRKVASKILEEMRDAARTAGAAPGPAGNPRKKKAPTARALIKDCRAAWEAYCERPGKTRLKKVFVCLRRMEKSKAATVKSERTRCLRSARAEDRKHGYALT